MTSVMQALIQVSRANVEKTPEGDGSTLVLGSAPEPTLAPTGHVVVKVHAAALNPVDIKRTVLPLQAGPPPVVGYDVAGVIQYGAPDVTSFQKGDRVFGDVVADSLGPKITGSVAEFTVVRADLLAHIPDGVSFTDAAALPLAAMTALQALRLTGATEGKHVFASGGAGGVGIHLMQIAKAHLNVSQVATTASAQKTDFVKKHGADVVINYKEQDAGEELQGWADAVIDLTGEIDMGLKIKKEDGQIVSIVKADLPLCDKHILKPCKEDIETIACLLAEGKLTPVIDSVFELKDAEKAVQLQASRHAKGKIVIKIRE